MQYPKKQLGVAWLPIILVLLFIGALVTIVALQYKSAYDYGNETDNALIAIKTNNKNIYAQGTQAIMEIAQVPTMYAKDLESIITKEIQGKYGKDGSQATMQWLQDRNITLPPNLYDEITQQIKAFRAKFEANQTRMIDVRAMYQKAIGQKYIFGRGWWLEIAGFPRINLADYEPIITERTEKVYDAGKEDGPLKLR